MICRAKRPLVCKTYKWLKGHLYVKPSSELPSVICHMRSHSVTCHPTQVNTPRLNPSQAGWYSIYLSWSDGRLRWPWWLVIYKDVGELSGENLVKEKCSLS